MASKAAGIVKTSIAGTVTLVTGAQRGLGKAVIDHFRQNGSKVVCFDLASATDRGKLEQENTLTLMGSVSDENQVAIAMKKCKEIFGRLDHVITCASIHHAQLIHANYPTDQTRLFSMVNFNEMLRTNIGGRFNVIRQAVALMKENKPDKNGQRGVIINAAGLAAYDGMIGQSAVSACEGATVSMTLPLARDLSEVGIRVATIAPGFFNTLMTKDWAENTINTYADMAIFPKRYGQPTEFAEMCKSICENPMINGETIRLDAANRMFY